MKDDYSNESAFLNRIVNLFKEVKLFTGEGCSMGYSDAFTCNSNFTEFISRVVDKVADDLKLRHAREYYTLDHVLYNDDDRIQKVVYHLALAVYMVHGSST